MIDYMPYPQPVSKYSISYKLSKFDKLTLRGNPKFRQIYPVMTGLYSMIENKIPC